MTAATDTPRLIDFMYERMKHKGTGKVMERRKLANNTYGRLVPGGIAIRLHNTDVVIFRHDGTVTLQTGGWYTRTTKDRINTFSGPTWEAKVEVPEFSVYSLTGTWHVEIRRWDPDVERRYGDYVSYGDWVVLAKHRFFDGITFDAATGRLMNSEQSPNFDRIDAWNNNIEKLIDATFRKLTPEKLDRLRSVLRITAFDSADVYDAEIQCAGCNGSGVEDIEHLLDHLEQREVTIGMVIAAYHRYLEPTLVAERDLSYAVNGRGGRHGPKFHLRKWLRKQLKRGVAIQ